LFAEDKEKEEEKDSITHKEGQTVKSNEITAKMTYQYPKERSFRFPVIPDERETEGKEDEVQVRRPEERKQRPPLLHTNRRQSEPVKNTRKIYKKDDKPFVPTEVPSPVYGLQKRNKVEPINNKPAFKRRKERSQVPFEKGQQKILKEEQNTRIDSKSVDQLKMTETVETSAPELASASEPNHVKEEKERQIPSNLETTEKGEKGPTVEVTEKPLTKTAENDEKAVNEQPAIVWREAKRRAVPYHLLNDPVEKDQGDDQWIADQQQLLEDTLKHFKVEAKVVDATQGPSVTRFEVQPGLGVKVSKIKNLSDDLKLNLAAKDIRIEAPIPGKNTVGIEIPNQEPQMVGLQSIFETEAFKESESSLSIALGLTIEGTPKVTNIRKMPHGLIAGATGSGKSVCINAILISLIYKASYEDVKFLLIDPKIVELAPYNGIPHLVSPVITDVKAANQALKWAVNEMEERYEKFAEEGVRDIGRFNEKIIKERRTEEKMPYIVIVIDELADLMMVSPQDVESSISRIAQKARACGIHLIVATQRPSVDVITGLIKSNIPTRIAFSVSSQVDSRTIIDTSGAEKLLGKGDMLFMENGARRTVRLQGPFVSDEEIERVTTYARSIAEPEYLFEQEQLLEQIEDDDETDELLDEAIEFIIHHQSASTSLLQRRFKIGYNRAARLMDALEARGIISGQDGSKPRDVLVSGKQMEDR